GGGGKGMRLVRDADRLADDIAGARREARAAFGDDTILVERFVQNPRHIEVQVLADTHGRVLHLGERECSLQRRHQKIVEEAPSPLLTPARRESMGAAAVATARACGYVGVGTVEFIVSADDPDAFFFMEMNTRLQVEHPVTELVTGLDLVEWQLRVAAGEHLTFEQQDVALQGHAVEARLYAEDPSRDFLPTGGTVLAYREPIGDGIRVDSALAVADVVGTAYDPMLAKIAAWAPSRPAALQRLAAALDRLVLLGVPTNAAFLAALLRGPDVVAGRLDTGLVERDVAGIVAAATAVTSTDAALAAAVGELADRGGATGWKSVGGWRLTDPAPVRRVYTLPGGARVVVVTEGGADGARVRVLGGPEDSVLLGPTAVSARADGDDLLVTTDGVERRWARAVRGPDQWWAHGPQTFLLRDAPPYLLARKHAAGSTLEVVRSPMPGTVVEVTVQVGDEVAAGTSLIVVEAMKMEHTVHAPHAGVVTEVSADRGDQVTLDQPLVLVEPKER
ncbi:MAG TPA: biotin/lipoyl-containing protein, partial [Mycobacteriales bacterium]|nr:biotin/lipoyl-containing protein [Mycobacteriales bacterium]